MFELPPLPYSLDALAPHLSRETLEYHHGKHHAAYVAKLNELTKGSPLEQASLEAIIKKESGAIFNNAAQIWNHTFFWNCLAPQGGMPSGDLLAAISANFDSFDNFKTQFSAAAATLFGSGWAWLVARPGGKLEIVQESNAGNPMTKGATPLLTCDVWEHAYYIDYRNARPKYIEAFWKITNWKWVETQWRSARG
jgi:Fe-Mn family superoxide dismutase